MGLKGGEKRIFFPAEALLPVLSAQKEVCGVVALLWRGAVRSGLQPGEARAVLWPLWESFISVYV